MKRTILSNNSKLSWTNNLLEIINWQKRDIKKKRKMDKSEDTERNNENERNREWERKRENRERERGRERDSIKSKCVRTED